MKQSIDINGLRDYILSQCRGTPIVFGEDEEMLKEAESIDDVMDYIMNSWLFCCRYHIIQDLVRMYDIDWEEYGIFFNRDVKIEDGWDGDVVYCFFDSGVHRVRCGEGIKVMCHIEGSSKVNIHGDGGDIQIVGDGKVTLVGDFNVYSLGKADITCYDGSGWIIMVYGGNLEVRGDGERKIFVHGDGVAHCYGRGIVYGFDYSMIYANDEYEVDCDYYSTCKASDNVNVLLSHCGRCFFREDDGVRVMFKDEERNYAIAYSIGSDFGINGVYMKEN